MKTLGTAPRQTSPCGELLSRIPSQKRMFDPEPGPFVRTACFEDLEGLLVNVVLVAPVFVPQHETVFLHVQVCICPDCAEILG